MTRRLTHSFAPIGEPSTPKPSFLTDTSTPIPNPFSFPFPSLPLPLSLSYLNRFSPPPATATRHPLLPSFPAVRPPSLFLHQPRRTAQHATRTANTPVLHKEGSRVRVCVDDDGTGGRRLDRAVLFTASSASRLGGRRARPGACRLGTELCPALCVSPWARSGPRQRRREHRRQRGRARRHDGRGRPRNPCSLCAVSAARSVHWFPRLLVQQRRPRDAAVAHTNQPLALLRCHSAQGRFSFPVVSLCAQPVAGMPPHAHARMHTHAHRHRTTRTPKGRTTPRCFSISV